MFEIPFIVHLFIYLNMICYLYNIYIFKNKLIISILTECAYKMHWSHVIMKGDRGQNAVPRRRRGFKAPSWFQGAVVVTMYYIVLKPCITSCLNHVLHRVKTM